MIKTHNRLRLKTKSIDAISDSILYHNDFHIKPVIDKDLAVLPEVESFMETLVDILVEKEFGASEFGDEVFDKETISKYLKSKTWFSMPAGDDKPALFESYPVVMDMCRDKGYKFTGRAHIMAFGTERCV